MSLYGQVSPPGISGGAVTDRSIPDLPVPDHLLLPVLEVAADTLRALESPDVPSSLRHLHGFDRRGLMHGPGPRQLYRAVVEETGFGGRVRENFTTRPAVESLLARWAEDDPVAVVDDAAARDDLALLASVLWACEPRDARFGLGLIVERDAQERRDRGNEKAVQARGRELDELVEARRRADAARMQAEAEAERANERLRDERSSRREREERAEARADAAQRQAENLTRQLSEAQAATADADARATREAGRARSLEADLARVRRDLTAARARFEQAPSRLGDHDATALADAARAAQQLSSSLETLRRRVRSDSARAEPPDAPAPREKPLARRAAPNVPAGLVAESGDGIEAMLRTPGAVLVVDGYNVSKRAWPDSTAADQRERLGIAVTGLHRRVGCDVVVVFDGDRLHPVPTLRRGGVRVVFSDADEEADELVVREVAGLPKRVPVVVASSDGWVRQHAGAEGAVVVGADALLALLRPTR